MTYYDRLGATPLDDGRTQFLIWGPHVESVSLRLLTDRHDEDIPMDAFGDGYWRVSVADVRPGDRYWFRLDGETDRPDPTSRYQPDGVHKASAVIDYTFNWTDDGFLPPSARNSVIYEMHVGTFTEEGTFEAVIPHLQRLRDLGITTLELLPIGHFPGTRNWGYDGVNLFAAHSAYGGPDGLRMLVNAAHEAGLAVLLDVVYNHLGPEGNYLRDFGPYFTDRYRTPWGDAVNLDGVHSDHVRRFFIENALYWLDVCHIDGFRLDATHALIDQTAYKFIQQLRDEITDWSARNNKPILLFAENDTSDRRILLPPDANGYGLDGVWLDDLHHTLHVALTDEVLGYYEDYADPTLFPKVLAGGFAYTGEYSPSRKRRHGTRSDDIPTDRFVVSTQNHDQVGNRLHGERLCDLTDFEGLKLAAGLLLCSPYVPMIFMGEEYGETNPFQYFVSHGDEDLLEAVREGRRAEFADFEWDKSEQPPPDPGSPETFQRSKLDHTCRHNGDHAALYELFGKLLRLRRRYPVMTSPHRAHLSLTHDHPYGVCMERRDERNALRVFYNISDIDGLNVPVPAGAGEWGCWVDSAAWGVDTQCNLPATLNEDGPDEIALAARSFAIYIRKPDEGA